MSEKVRDASEAETTERAQLTRGENHLFVIAIDRYAHQGQLTSCVRDAEDLVRIITKNYTFNPDNVITLFNEAATASHILTQLDAYSTILSDTDSLIIYYAGHGVVRNNIGYWIPADAHHFTEFLPLSSVHDFLQVLRARHVFIMVDACFAGRFFVGTCSNAALEYIEMHPSRYVLTAGRDEQVLDGQAGGNSPFADSLKYHLASARDSLGAVTLSDLVMRDVAAKVSGFQTPRHGELNINGNHHGQFYFHPRSPAEEDRNVFVSRYFARGGVLVPPQQRAERLAYFDKYDHDFQAMNEVAQAELRQKNTRAYLQFTGLDIQTLKNALA